MFRSTFFALALAVLPIMAGDAWAVKPPFSVEVGMVLHYRMENGAIFSIRVRELGEQVTYKVLNGNAKGCEVTLTAEAMNASSGLLEKLPSCQPGLSELILRDATYLFLSRNTFSLLEGMGKAEILFGGKVPEKGRWTLKGKIFHDVKNQNTNQVIPIPCLELVGPEGQTMLVYNNNRVPLLVFSSQGNIRLDAISYRSLWRW